MRNIEFRVAHSQTVHGRCAFQSLLQQVRQLGQRKAVCVLGLLNMQFMQQPHTRCLAEMLVLESVLWDLWQKNACNALKMQGADEGC